MSTFLIKSTMSSYLIAGKVRKFKHLCFEKESLEGCRIENGDEKSRVIYVDADACPVKEEIVLLADTYRFCAIFVASYAHVSTKNIGGEWIYVDMEKEAVDLYIVNHASNGDIVVTQDIGLASLLLKRQVIVLSPRGKQYLEKDMDETLYIRYLSSKERRAGKYGKGPRAFAESDRHKFVKTLKKILSDYEGIKKDFTNSTYNRNWF
jgi:uncharacterized protein YaiI (UPF0178 family)